MRQLTRRCNFPSYWLQIPRNDATLSIFLPTPSVCCLYSLREHLCLTLTIFPSELIKAAILQKNSFCALPPHPAKAFMCPFSDLLHSYLGLATYVNTALALVSPVRLWFHDVQGCLCWILCSQGLVHWPKQVTYECDNDSLRFQYYVYICLWNVSMPMTCGHLKFCVSRN